MPPAHYALSEILIVLVSIYSLTTFYKERQFYSFAGVFLISCAALIASVRFGINYQSELKSFHQLLSAISLLFGVPLIVLETIRRSGIFREKSILIFLVIVTLIGLLVMFYAKNLLILVALYWLIIGTVIATFIHRKNLLFRLLSGIFFSIIIFNLAIRRSDVFEPSISWHIYHIGIAVWLYQLTKILTQKDFKYV